MSLSNEAENLLVLLLFNNQGWPNAGDVGGLRGSVTAGSFFISLHTSDPGESNDQTLSEANYVGYARVPVARASGAGGFTCVGDTASNTSSVAFGACTSGASACTHFGIGTASSGVGHLIGSGALSNPSTLQVSPGITPSFAPGTLQTIAA